MALSPLAIRICHRDGRVTLRAHQADPAELRRADDAQRGARGARAAAHDRAVGVAGRGAPARRPATQPARRVSAPATRGRALPLRYPHVSVARMSAAPASAELDLDAANRELEHAMPPAILAWTWREFRPKVVLTCSFQHDGVVLAHMLRDIAPEVPVVFIDTGFHFPETLAYRDEIKRRFGIELLELHPIMPREQF